MSDQPFDTNTPDTNIDAFMRRFMGPEMVQFIKPLIELSIGDALRSHAAERPFGPNALFGQQNVGGNLIDYFNQQTIQTVMQGSEDANRDARREFRMNLQQIMGATDPARSAAGFNATNFIADALYNQVVQPRQLQQGLQEAARLMGVGSPIGLAGDLRTQQMDINRQAAALTAAIQRDFSNNWQQFYGLTGRDIGQLSAEMARTGMIRPGMDFKDAQVGGMMRDAARLASVSGRFFQGSVLDRQDAIVAITGVGMGTWNQGQMADMLTTMDATARVSGFTRAQVMQLAMNASEVSQAMGQDPMGAMANASDIAQLYAGALRSSNGGAFINEQRLRATVVQRVTGAQESDLARAIAGAGAQMDESRRSDFLAAIRAETRRGGTMSAERVAGVAGRFGVSGSGMDLINAGYTQGAERLRAEGFATDAVMESNLNLLGAVRAQAAGNMLQGFNVQGFMRTGQPATMANIARYYQRTTGRTMTATQQGLMRRMFADQARASGYGNAEEMETVMAATETMDLIEAQISQQADIDETFQEFGQTRGIAGFAAFVKAAGEGGADSTSLGRMWSFVTGQTNISREDMGKLMKAQQGALAAARGGDSAVFAGMDAAFNALTTGTIGGKILTKEQRQQFQAAFNAKTKEEAIKAFTKIGSQYGDKKMMRKLEVSNRAAELKKARETAGMEDLTEDELSREAEFGEQVEEYRDELKAGRVDIDSTKKKKYLSIIEEFENRKKGQTIEQFQAGLDKDKQILFKDFRSSLKREATFSNRIGGSAAGGLEGLIGQLLELLKGITENGKVKVSDSKG